MVVHPAAPGLSSEHRVKQTKKKPSFSDFQNCQNEGICFNSALEISTKIDLGKSNL